MKNLEEAPQHEMAAHATGSCQGGAESWEVNYVPYNGSDSPFTIGEVKRSNKGGGVDNQGGGKGWEVLGSRKGGSDDVKLSNQPNTAADQDGVEKWRSSYVPFSPPSSFPWKTVEDESSSKGYDGNGGDRVEVHTLLLRRVFPTLANFCFNCSRHRWMWEILELVFVYHLSWKGRSHH